MNFTQLGNRHSAAWFSPCMQYRYGLYREIPGGESRTMAVIACNPSTADHEQGDPTVTRCINRAKEMGFGGFEMLNIFAWRATDPKDMRRAIEPIGLENDEFIRHTVNQCDMVICAWGTHGKYKDRGDAVLKLLKDVDLYALKITKSGHPQHPLYISNKTKPVLWRAKS